ncbi:hypothetical protein [Spiroplasma sp. AdecLV25b]|uniref:hypothetical protein n=1 Tax=Spiroplasma sp. AdecLV25b TaxID=3027162 RepID=UPI0027E09245|nr:hypothetical protein [Spiroplasma sp. AdecLV25b]
MSEKKLSTLEKLKVIAEQKIHYQDSKIDKSIPENHINNFNINNNETSNIPVFKSSKQEFKTISIDAETKLIIKELKDWGVPINNSALFRVAVRQFYKEWKKKKEG